jgi:hypothetical protein
MVYYKYTIVDELFGLAFVAEFEGFKQVFSKH